MAVMKVFQPIGFFIVTGFFVFTISSISFSQNAESSNSMSIIPSDIESIQGKSIELRLKLKEINLVSGLIVFYDANNHDIVFDYYSIKNKELLKRIEKTRRGELCIINCSITQKDLSGTIFGIISNIQSAALGVLP